MSKRKQHEEQEENSKRVKTENDDESESDDEEWDEGAWDSWQVAFRNHEQHVPFAQPYTIHGHLRWFYSDMNRNRFPHGGETVRNPPDHHALMLKDNLYRLGMPKYLDQGGALGFQNQVRKRVLACRSGLGGKFREVEKWYLNNKQLSLKDKAGQADTDRQAKKLAAVERKHKEFDALWTEPRSFFPTLEHQHARDAVAELLNDALGIVLDYLAREDKAAIDFFTKAQVLQSNNRGDGLLILFEGQSDNSWTHPGSDLIDCEVGSVLVRKRSTCGSWLPHGASYNFPGTSGGKSTLVVHHVRPEVKTVVVQEIETSRGCGGYWGEGDVLMQPGVAIQVTRIDKIKRFSSFHTDRSAMMTREGPVRVVHTLVTASMST